MNRLARCVLLLLVGWIPATAAQGQLKPEQVPEYEIRARVLRSGQSTPRADQKFRFVFTPSPQVHEVQGTDWTPWVRITRKEIAQQLKRYPNSYLRRWPFVTGLRVYPTPETTFVDVQVRLLDEDRAYHLNAELFGPRLGLLISRQERDMQGVFVPRQYDVPYWHHFPRENVPAEDRPRRFVIVDRYIGLDDDRGAWLAGFEHLARGGFTALMVPPSPKLRALYEKTGLKRIAWAVYAPPGYAFDYDEKKITPQAIRRWAQGQAEAYRRAGFDPRQMALFTMSDEPGWYYPATFRALEQFPRGMKRFHEYLRRQGMTLKRLGRSGWQEVRPLGPNRVRTPEDRRLFYWTCRFFSWDSARHFARCRQELARAFGHELSVVTNWNFFAGRFYVPGPVANNRDKQHPDAAMGGHDWYEFARLRGGTMLWTEDWFEDGRAYQWSYYLARLRVAAREGGVQFGSYVIPRTAGGREEGITQKTLSIVGHGGKAIKYFVFGPEYVFPGNCYSDRMRQGGRSIVRDMILAHRAIAQAEDLLWPGRMPVPQVALLHPRSPQPWDALAPARKQVQIQGATNTHMNARRTGYLAELFDLYLALQHANVPADVIDEDMLTAEKLAPYRVLYITGPDVPAEGQRAVLEWVRRGGTLVLSPGAACWNRYHEPCRVLFEASGVPRAEVPRRFYNYLLAEPWAGSGQGTQGSFRYVGPRAKLAETKGQVVARFDDDQSPAVVVAPVGKGRVVQFAWFPGLSYWRSQKGKADGLPVGFAPEVRRWICWPVLELAGAKRLVEPSEPLVEVLYLESPRGVVLTVLNWSGRQVPKLRLKVRLPFRPSKANAVQAGKLQVRSWAEGSELQLPLSRWEVVSLYR